MYASTRLISIKAFTPEGMKLRDRIMEDGVEGLIFCDVFKHGEKIRKVPLVEKDDRRDATSPLGEWVRECFANHIGMIYIGAAAIAVRQIAPHIIGKLVDSPVIVIDEKGEYVIPILSGHVGGANEISQKIADMLGGKAVITTATDVNKKKSIDIYAKENYLGITNKDAIKNVSMKMLRNEEVRRGEDFDIVSFEDYLNPKIYGPDEKLLLYEKPYVIGIGCRKDIKASRLSRFITENIAEYINSGVEINDFMKGVAAITSIDLKREEMAVNLWAEQNMIPFVTYGRDELLAVPGEFTESQFVEEAVGVGSVCERAASCFAAGRGGNYEIPVRKVSRDGMTFALAYSKNMIYPDFV